MQENRKNANQASFKLDLRRIYLFQESDGKGPDKKRGPEAKKDLELKEQLMSSLWVSDLVKNHIPESMFLF